jgi:glycyl-tRNA synthetase beta chain
MGYYYATNDGESEAVAAAIEEQYLPRHAGDRLPATPAGLTLSIADRLDTLAGIFSLGKRPSGNKDPFSLRRQALGIVRVLIETEIELNLNALLSEAIALQPAAEGNNVTAAELYDFIVDRMRAWYLAGQAPDIPRGKIHSNIFESVSNRAPASLFDFHQRLSAVQNFVDLDSAESLASANKRIANLLKKSGGVAGDNVDETLFDVPEERDLHTAVFKLLPEHQADLKNHNYGAALERLAKLHGPIDSYFDEVMVMSDDVDIRTNRLAQLDQLRNLFLDVADISFLQ